jgi:MFS family permease
MLGVGIIVPILPVYARDMGASAMMLGLIFSSQAASRALVSPYVGAWSDYLGRKRFLVAGLLGYTLVAVTLTLAKSPLDLVLNRAVQGLFAAMILPVVMALVADLAPPGQEGRAFGAINQALLLGFGMGPILGGAVYDHLGVVSNFLIMAALSLVATGLVAWRVREPAGVKRTKRAMGWGVQLALLRHRGMMGLFISRAGSAMAMGSFIAFLPVLGAERGLSNLRVGVLLAVNVLVMTALQMPAGLLADRMSRLGLTAGGQVAAALCKAALPLAGGFWGLMALVVLEGIGAGLSSPAMLALVSQEGRRAGVGHGASMGFFTMAMSAGVCLGPILGGWLADHWGMDLAFYNAGVWALLGAGGLWLLRPLPGLGGAQPD